MSAPAITPGAAIGRVTRRKVVHGVAPRSALASCREVSTPAMRARTMKVTTATENIAWDTMRRTRPLLNQVRSASTPRVTNHGRNEMPSTISGVTSVVASSPVRPRAHQVPSLARASAMPPSVPSTVASSAEPTAACRLVITEETMTSLLMPEM